MNQNIFEYFNGERKVFGDPLAILRDFTGACEGDPNELFRLTQSENPAQAVPATRSYLAAAREALKMVPFSTSDGSGATDEVVYSVMESFFDWWSKKKSTFESEPTSLPPTV